MIRENAYETTTLGFKMLIKAITTIAGSIALIVSPVAANDENAATIETTTAELHACSDDMTRDYYEVQSCVRSVYFDHRFDDTMPTCEWEDSQNCLWMEIDGFGTSFIDVDGIAYYMRNVETRTV